MKNQKLNLNIYFNDTLFEYNFLYKIYYLIYL